MFQSPCGDYVSGKRTGISIPDSGGERFQSPCGDYVSGKSYDETVVVVTSYGFSPLAGIMLAESLHRHYLSQSRVSFSPLAGIMLAESPPSETKSSW